MASKYQVIVSVAEHTANDITKNGDTWMRFLTTAASNYKYRFKDQLLIYAQKPDAVACAEIETWNRLGRWVNKGTKGIALLVDKDTPYKLRHVFDVSDTNSRAGYGVYLWRMAERYESAVTESLENSFGELESHTDFVNALMDTAKNAVEDNYSDYLSDLVSVKVGSYLDELDDLNTKVWLKDALTSSIGFMLLSRCGIDPREYYSREDFARVFDFSTPETVAILGGAASDISEMVLREIGATVKNLQMEERKQNRTFAPEQANDYNNGGNKTTERSAEYGTDLYNAGRLSPAGSERAGEPEDREIWNAAAQLPSGASGRDLHRDAAVGQAERSLGGDRPDGKRDDEPSDSGAGEGAGRDGEPEGVESDEVGGPDEQHQESGGGDRDDGADLQLTEPLPSVEEQQNTIMKAEAETASAFAVSQEDIDAVLTRGSGVSEGKFRIYEQYLKQESAADNAKMLKEEYGIGGAYPAVSGSRLDEGHDGKGIQISRGDLSNPDASILLSWSKVEKRIGELIAADRYLSKKEKEQYPAYRRESADRAAWWKISEDFRALIYDYNDYWTQLEQDNSAVEAAHRSEILVESAARHYSHHRQSQANKPFEKVSKLEHEAQVADTKLHYEKTQQEHPEMKKNRKDMNKHYQKSAIKKEYAAARKSGSQTASAATSKTGKKTREKIGDKVKEFFTNNKKVFIWIGLGLIILVLLAAGISSCTAMFSSTGQSVILSSYLSEDKAMLDAEAQYCEMEAELKDKLDNFESYYPGYDEYNFDLDDIEHDPYVLISILSALHEGEFTLSEVQGTLDMLFDKQYILTTEEIVEVRYRTETRVGSYTVTDPETGATSTEYYTYEVEVPYNYYIMNVELENFNLSHVPVYIMSQDQLSMYALYMSGLGNREDLFPNSGYVDKYIDNPPDEYTVNSVYMSDPTFATLITEAEKYLNYPYVWGGSNPDTSFDCSGFVSYVLTNSGLVNTGRLGAQGLYNVCTPVSRANAKPGDLIFFTGTYDTPGVSHVGIYVGDNVMLHCGDPIQYSAINTSYWQSHFYAFGRPAY